MICRETVSLSRTIYVHLQAPVLLLLWLPRARSIYNSTRAVIWPAADKNCYQARKIGGNRIGPGKKKKSEKSVGLKHESEANRIR